MVVLEGNVGLGVRGIERFAPLFVRIAAAFSWETIQVLNKYVIYFSQVVDTGDLPCILLGLGRHEALQGVLTHV